MSKILVGLLILFSTSVIAQNSAWKRTGTAEKLWALSHPFVAKKTYHISVKVVKVLDSLRQTKYFEGNTLSGSKADAVRHAFWMASLSSEIGARKALKFGKAHEKKNKRDFEKGKLEESYLPDAAAMNMDLFNNEFGASLASEKSRTDLMKRVLTALEAGKLVYIKQNAQGEFLNESGDVIPLNKWSGFWQNDRVLVPTN